MKLVRVLFVAALSVPALPAVAATDDDAAFGHMLSLVQVFVGLAAKSDDPVAGLKATDDVLAGRNLEANRAASGLFNEITAGMPAEHRDKVAAIAGNVLALARRDLAKQPTSLAPAYSTDAALQARKDLTAMGLRYFDEEQFRAAIKRGDKLAVDLFVAGQGIDPAVVSKSLPAAR